MAVVLHREPFDELGTLLAAMIDDVRLREGAAGQAYDLVGSEPSQSVLARVARGRVAAHQLESGDPERAVELLTENLRALEGQAAPAEAIAAAEDELATALVTAGRPEDARSMYERTPVEIQSLTPAGRAFRLRATLACCADDAALLELVAADAATAESPIASHTLATVAAAVSAADVKERPRLDELLLELVARALVDLPERPPRQLASCAKQLTRAGRHDAAERCWRLLWLCRRQLYGETDPLTVKTRALLASSLGDAGRPEEAAREYEWLMAATRDDPALPKSARWTILDGYAELVQTTGNDKGRIGPVLRELKEAKRRLKEHAA